METGAPSPLARTCLNCGATVDGAFCSSCGQSTTLHVPTVREFVHEFATHYIAIEGALGLTLKTLFLRPGKLTVEFLAGRRVRYVPPLRLFLSFSVVFFLVLGWQTHKVLRDGTIHPNALVTIDPYHDLRQESGDDSPLRVRVGDAASVPAASTPSPTSPTTAERPSAPSIDVAKLNQKLNARLPTWLQRPESETPKTFEEEVAHVSANFAHYVPYTPFFLMPAFAFVVMLVYWSRRRLYAEHLVFAMHIHAALFAFLTVEVIIPSESLDNLIFIGFLVYGLFALRKVYGGRWLPSIARTLVISVTYLFILGFAAAFTVFLSLVT